MLPLRAFRGELYPCESEGRLCDEVSTGDDVEVVRRRPVHLTSPHLISVLPGPQGRGLNGRLDEGGINPRSLGRSPFPTPVMRRQTVGYADLRAEHGSPDAQSVRASCVADRAMEHAFRA